MSKCHIVGNHMSRLIFMYKGIQRENINSHRTVNIVYKKGVTKLRDSAIMEICSSGKAEK